MMLIHTAGDIAPGAELTVTYVSPRLDLEERSFELLGKEIACACSLCIAQKTMQRGAQSAEYASLLQEMHSMEQIVAVRATQPADADLKSALTDLCRRCKQILPSQFYEVS